MHERVLDERRSRAAPSYSLGVSVDIRRSRRERPAQRLSRPTHRGACGAHAHVCCHVCRGGSHRQRSFCVRGWGIRCCLFARCGCLQSRAKASVRARGHRRLDWSAVLLVPVDGTMHSVVDRTVREGRFCRRPRRDDGDLFRVARDHGVSVAKARRWLWPPLGRSHDGDGRPARWTIDAGAMKRLGHGVVGHPDMSMTLPHSNTFLGDGWARM
jgi:hypothetical protein